MTDVVDGDTFKVARVRRSLLRGDLSSQEEILDACDLLCRNGPEEEREWADAIRRIVVQRQVHEVERKVESLDTHVTEGIAPLVALIASLVLAAGVGLVIGIWVG